MARGLLVFDLSGVIVAHDNVLLWHRLADLIPQVRDEASAEAITVTIPGAVQGREIGDG